MKKSLLATVAAVALIAGAGLASAAEGAKEQPKAAAPAGQSETQKAPDAKAGADVKGHAQTTGAGSAEMKAEPKANADVKGKADKKAEMKSEKAKPSTTGAGTADEEKAGTKSEMNKSGKPDTKAMDNKASDSKSKSSASEQKMAPAGKSAADSKSSTESKTTGQGSAGAKSASVNLTTEQKTKIRTTVIESKGAPKVSRSSINFNISVGTVVPRDRVHYVAVTPTLIEIHPEWRGHMYFVVDDEIIIVDSRGRIVAVLDV